MLEFCHPYKMYKYTCLTTVLSIETCSQQQKLLSKDDENKEKEEIKNRRRIAFKAPSSMLSVPTITGLNPSFTQNAEQQGSTAFTSPHKRQFKEKHHYTHARKHTDRKKGKTTSIQTTNYKFNTDSRLQTQCTITQKPTHRSIQHHYTTPSAPTQHPYFIGFHLIAPQRTF